MTFPPWSPPKKTIQENEIAIKGLELDIATRKDTLVKLKVQQYETKKNDEFTALGNEIERYNGEVDDLETQELELMEKADGLRADHAKASDALSLTQGMVDEEITLLDKREQNAKASWKKPAPSATRSPPASMRIFSHSTIG